MAIPHIAQRLFGVFALTLVTLGLCGFLFFNKKDKTQKVSIDTNQMQKEERIAFMNRLKLTPDDWYLGNPNAKVVMVSYDSMSCPHCARFYKVTFPVIKEKFINSNSILFIHRTFPLDKIALFAAQALKCADEKLDLPINRKMEKLFAAMSGLFYSQDDWINSKKYQDIILEMASGTGVSAQVLKECVESSDAENEILRRTLDDGKTLKITATPTVFINGAEIPYSKFSPRKMVKVIEDYIAKTQDSE